MYSIKERIKIYLNSKILKLLPVMLLLVTIIFALISLSYIPANNIQGLNKDSKTEIVKVLSGGTFITPANSGLLSEKVTSIFIDSFNIKWFGTNLGISRFDGSNWDTINTSNFLLNDNIKQMAYERTNYGHELWIATDGGLSVAGFDIDGITSATTYNKDNSGLINDTVTAVGIDVLHTRWIGTRTGISVFQEGTWDALLTYRDANDRKHNLSDIVVTGVVSYANSEQAYISTYGGGVLRFNYDEINGFTGASTMGNPWSGLQTNNINSIRIYDTIQYYGAVDGFYIHKGPNCRKSWSRYTIEAGLLSNNVRAVEVDDSGAIWIGTDAGLNIKDGKLWYSYETEDGLINPVINDIRMDFDGTIWVATDGGIENFTEIPGRLTGGLDPIQCMDVIASDVTDDSSRIYWTVGDVGNRIVFIKEGNDGLVVLDDSTTYAADSEYGKGDEANGWYCIYNNTGNILTVSGLRPKTMYRVMACEYYGDAGAEEYVTVSSTGNPANFTTMKSDVENNRVEEFTILPNPFSEYLEIHNLRNSLSSMVSIYNIAGKLQKKLILTGNENKINTSELSPGTYIIQINNGQRSYNFKAVKK
jgi:hypothetical protein